MPRPCQNASKISSKRSQSECVAQNSARNAGLSDEGRTAAGEARTASASLRFGQADLEAVVAQGAGEAGEPAAGAERSSVIRWAAEGSPRRMRGGACPSRLLQSHAEGAEGRRSSRHLAEEPLGHLAGHPRAVLMGLQQAHHGFVDGFRLLPQLVDVEARERRRPVERLRDAGHLAQVLLADRRDHARDLQGQRDIDAGRARQDDLRLAIDLGEIDVVIEAAAAQRVGQFARPLEVSTTRGIEVALMVPSSGMLT